MTSAAKPSAEYWQERATLAEEATMQMAEVLARFDPRLHGPLQAWADRWANLSKELDARHGVSGKEQS